MNRWLETDTQKTARNIINVLNESAAGMVKKEINRDKPEEAPKEEKVALEKRVTKAAIKGRKPESKNAKMPEKTAKKIVKEELEPEAEKSIEDQIADLQDYLNNTPEIAEDEKEAIQAEIDDLISQLGEKDLEFQKNYTDKLEKDADNMENKRKEILNKVREKRAKNESALAESSYTQYESVLSAINNAISSLGDNEDIQELLQNIIGICRDIADDRDLYVESALTEASLEDYKKKEDFENEEDKKEESKLQEDFDSTLDLRVKPKFKERFPEEGSFINQIPEDLTFRKVMNALNNEEDIYDVIGVNDSVVREEIFMLLSDLLDIEYDEI